MDIGDPGKGKGKGMAEDMAMVKGIDKDLVREMEDMEIGKGMEKAISARGKESIAGKDMGKDAAVIIRIGHKGLIIETSWY